MRKGQMKRKLKNTAHKPQKKGIVTSAAYTSEFSQEFAVQTEQLLRKRFLWFTMIVGGLGVLGVASGILSGIAKSGEVLEAVTDESRSSLWAFFVVGIPWTLLYISAFAWVVYDKPLGKRLINVSIMVVTLDGLLNLVAREIGMPYNIGLAGFGITHFIAALFLPWTPVQAMKSAGIVLLANVFVRLVLRNHFWEMTGSQWSQIGVGLLFTPIIAVPGTMVCAMRHSSRTQKFKTQFFQNRYGDLRRELVDAKRIHESLFPEPVTNGSVTMSYTYEPARAIGGDFIFAHQAPGRDEHTRGDLSLVVIDVTGHGIPAALTVNRLHGELTRIYAENTHASPGEVMELINRYVHLTLAQHSIYATGLCVRINTESQTLEYSSAGHPPAFIRAVDGTIEDLDSTAIVLGAAAAEDFESGQRTTKFFAGDALLAYTDGVTEARSVSGTMFQIEGLRSAIIAAGSVKPGQWPAQIRKHVENFRYGIPEDDLLVVELRRSLPIRTSRDRSTDASLEPQPVGSSNP